jgi:peptide/nickel transport system permease protein
MLLSDWLIYFLLMVSVVMMLYIRKKPHWRDPLRQLLHRKLAMIALVILIFYTVIGLLDSIHFEVLRTNDHQYQITQSESLLDLMIYPLGQQEELTYSAPFATQLYNPAIMTLPDGREVRGYPALQFAGAHLHDVSEKNKDIILRVIYAILIASGSFVLLVGLQNYWLSRRHKTSFIAYLALIIKDKTPVPWREVYITFFCIWNFIWLAIWLATHYHVLGTDKVGQDVFYETIKSIRTGLLIGTLTTLFMLPFALFLGMLAGFFGGLIDDVIQYVYTTLSSIPGVLLIAASILVLQVYVSNHSQYFPTLTQRADARLLAFCFILGITSWASLCRLLRGETLKLREYEYVQSARVIGVGRWKILLRHIMPNIMHIVMITLVLDFSGLVLAEAVLSYIGIGIDPTMMSWGNMINSSRLELAREPVVWWPLFAALFSMFGLVLSANLFADTVRDALDPRLHQLEEK